MERMSGLDASFLYLETDEQMMVINGVVHLDVSTISEGYSFERLRSGLARRVKSVPPFRRRIHDSASTWDTRHGWRTSTSTSLVTSTGSRSVRTAARTTFWPRAGGSPPRRSTAPTRCGRCGSSSGVIRQLPPSPRSAGSTTRSSTACSAPRCSPPSPPLTPPRPPRIPNSSVPTSAAPTPSSSSPGARGT
ncbi:hypothetical protein G6028_07365 [Dietzia cercidiphylli]|nr:hypothetical protein [Dietzia cercidiphylli]